MLLLWIALLIGLMDLIGSLVAISRGLKFRNIYWLPMGGWIALWQQRSR